MEGIAIGIIDYEEDEMVQEDLSGEAITNPRRSPWMYHPCSDNMLMFDKILNRKQNLERKFSRELLNLYNEARCIYTQ